MRRNRGLGALAVAWLALSCDGNAIAQSLRWVASGHRELELFGSTLRWLDDLDGDGHQDLAIGAVSAEDGSGRVYLHSSANGELLRELAPLHGAIAFGAAIAAVGDSNGDGASELAVLQTWESQNLRSELPTPPIVLRSTADGIQLAEFSSRSRGELERDSIVTLSDIDGDGVREVATTTLDDDHDRTNFTPTRGPSVTIVSGATLVPVRELWLLLEDQRVARIDRCANAGDVDHDGRDDLIASRASVNPDWHDSTRYIGAVASAGDLDGDGAAEIAAARHPVVPDGSLLQRVAILAVPAGATLGELESDTG